MFNIHLHVGHYKEKFECSFHSRKYWFRVTWIDCKGGAYLFKGSLCGCMTMKEEDLNNGLIKNQNENLG